MNEGTSDLESVIVVVEDDAQPRIQEVAENLKEQGMNVDRVLPFTGVISGSIPRAGIPGLREVTGVMEVEEEAVTELPPSDSRIW